MSEDKIKKSDQDVDAVKHATLGERAVELYRQGAELWRNGDRAGAISAYTESASLDPHGPGATALEMTRSIMNFYDTNQFNP